MGDPIRIRVYHGDQLVDDALAPYRRTFGEVPVGQPLVYINSLMNVAVALNQGNYAASHKIESGLDWFIELSKE
jgi:S-adenosylmethionine hydrolase